MIAALSGPAKGRPEWKNAFMWNCVSVGFTSWQSEVDAANSASRPLLILRAMGCPMVTYGAVTTIP